MPTARQSQSDLPNRPTYLPPLSPSAKSHPHHASGTPVPQAYQLKLSSDLFNAIVKGQDQATIEFTDHDQGTIHLSNHANVSFTTRSINTNHDDTARAALYSRRGSNMRLVGPGLCEMDIHQSPNPRPNVKIRTVNPRGINKRDLKSNDDAQRSAKKPRGRNNPGKRPRGDSPARNSTALPTTPLQSYKPNGSNIKVPRSVGASAPLRSTPVSPPTENTRQTGAKRSVTGSINSIGALGQRFSPPSQKKLPKPIGRQPPGRSRQAAPAASRGGSPNTQSGNGAGMGAKSKLEDGEEIRRHVVHSLALGDMTLTAMRRRHEARNMDSVVVDEVLGEVADLSGDNYKLKKRGWREVYDSYSGYSEVERKRMRQNRVEVCGLVDGKLSAEYMNDDGLYEEINGLSKQFSRGAQKIEKEEDERLARADYERVHVLYGEVIERMSSVNERFVQLREKLETSKEARGKEEVKKTIRSCERRHGESFKRFERVLPKMHSFLKDVQEAVLQYEP